MDYQQVITKRDWETSYLVDSHILPIQGVIYPWAESTNGGGWKADLGSLRPCDIRGIYCKEVVENSADYKVMNHYTQYVLVYKIVLL